MILIFAVRMKLIEWKGSYCSKYKLEITIKKLYDYFEDRTSGTSGTSG